MKLSPHGKGLFPRSSLISTPADALPILRPSLDNCAKSRGSARAASSNGDDDSTTLPKLSRSKDRARQADRDLLLDVLSSSATKRDAKTYLSRFTTQAKSPTKSTRAEEFRSPKNEVNLGALYGRGQDAVGSATGSASEARKSVPLASAVTTRVAVVVLRSVESIDDKTLNGVGHTLAQLSRLGLGCVVVADHEGTNDPDHLARLRKQAERVLGAVEADGTVRARRLDRLFYSNGRQDLGAFEVDTARIDQLVQALVKGFVVVVTPIVNGPSGETVGVDANGVTLSLASGFRKARRSEIDTSPSAPAKCAGEPPNISLDRIIVVDPRGGIPQVNLGGSHVFVNLEQEFETIRSELEELLVDTSKSGPGTTRSSGHRTSQPSEKNGISIAAATMSRGDTRAHLENLKLARGALAVLPTTSSALIITPMAAGFSAKGQIEGVGTRSQRSPLIHNLLTDKPFFSSSLPRRRLAAHNTLEIPSNHPSMSHAPPTHLKHGVPVVLTPDPTTTPWRMPTETTFSLSLDDPRINKTRLVELIEDSFGRPLDVSDYFARIGPRLAGIIIAGDYDGGAILTWEQPRSFRLPVSSISSPPASRNLVPYLDKFAVLKRAQGGGVADVVFSAMVRRCFPEGVCWRSRNGNPVNKWYFERAQGAFRLPSRETDRQAWTMFWTTEDLQPGRFAEYAEVCLAVQSSWADGKKNPE